MGADHRHGVDPGACGGADHHDDNARQYDHANHDDPYHDD
jgi:hypothetical protein